jgi:hypothetical protein
VGSDEKMLSQIGSALMFPDNSQIATRLSALELAQAKTNEKIRRILDILKNMSVVTKPS